LGLSEQHRTAQEQNKQDKNYRSLLHRSSPGLEFASV
jgi:hypothetical protein